MTEQSDGVEMAAGYKFQAGHIRQEGTVQFRTDIADMPFDVPDTLAGAPTAAEQRNVAGVPLRIVGTDQRKQRRLAGAVGTFERPALPFVHHPVERLQDGTAVIADGNLRTTHNLG